MSFEMVIECTLLISAEGELVRANKAACELFEAGTEAQLLQQHTLAALVCSGDQSLLMNVCDKVACGSSVTAKLHLMSLKGNLRYVQFHITPNLPQAATSQRQYYCIFHDILGEQSLADELKISHLRLAEAQTRAKLGSWERDLLTQKGVWSKEMYRLFDLDSSREPPPFSDVAEMIHPHDRPQFIAIHDKFIEEGTAYSLDVRLQNSAGQLLWIDVRSETIRSENGTAIILRGTAQDITERKLIEAELLVREEHLASSQARAKVGSWQFDIASNTLTASKEHFRLVEQNPEQGEVYKEQYFKMLHPEDVVATKKHLQEMVTTVGQHGMTSRIILADGSIRWLQGLEETLADENGEPYLVIGTLQDVTERTLAEQQLQVTKNLLETTQAIAKLGGWEIDLRTKAVICTHEIYRILETTPEEYAPTFEKGLTRYTPKSAEKAKLIFAEAVSNGNGFDAEFTIYTFKNNILEVRIMGEVVFENGKPAKLTGILQNISEHKYAQKMLELANDELENKNRSLERIANYDALTHLPNRVLLSDRLAQAIIQSQRRNTLIAVAFLDLDGFKEINDRYGHGLGDEFLVKLANSLKLSLRECDTLARIGGDEFVAILTDITSATGYKPMITRLLEAASTPIRLHDHDIQVSASIGVTIFPDDGVDADQLLRHADQAMYVAKQEGKNQHHVFDVRQDTQVKTLHVELDRIRKALEEQEFVLFYQPKVNLASGIIIGVEALIRWQHPSRGLLSPIAFLPIIQDTLFSIRVGEWVIDTALIQLEQWLALGIRTNISVNVGAIQLQQDDFVLKLQNLLAKHPSVAPSQLELEVLEISAINDIGKVTEMIHSCQAFGVTFALDDFGTGYSSLSYLKQLPAEMIKIDQTFVRDMLVDNEDLSIVKGIIGLSDVFKRQVIAEGVETKEHCEKLLAIGCELAQGYGIARPMPAEDFPQWAEVWARSHSDFL